MRNVKVFVDGELVKGFSQGTPLEREVAFLEYWAQDPEHRTWCYGFGYHRQPKAVNVHHYCVGGSSESGTLVGIKQIPIEGEEGHFLFEVYVMD